MSGTRTGGQRTLIKDVHAVTMDDRLGERLRTDILIEGNTIIAVDDNIVAADAEIVDGRHRLAMPGLIDTHRHLWMSLFRGWALNGDLKTVQENFHHRYGARFSPEDTYVSCLVSLAEAIDSGITTIHAWEMNVQSPKHADAVVRAMQKVRIRGRFSYGPPTARPATLVSLNDVMRIQDEMFNVVHASHHTTKDGLIHLGVASRGVELLEPDIWKPEFAFARKEGLPVTAHLNGNSITQLSENGALGPDILGVHSVEVDDDQIGLLRAHSIPISVAVISMAKIAQPSSPIVKLMRAGVRVCLSVDAVSAGDNCDMFAVMKMSILKERMSYGDATVYSPDHALRQATIDGANAMGLAQVTGSLTPGKRADLILIRTDDTNMIPMNDAVASIVFAAQPRNIDSVWVDGLALKRNGKLIGFDVRRLGEDAQRSIDQLKEKVACLEFRQPKEGALKRTKHTP